MTDLVETAAVLPDRGPLSLSRPVVLLEMPPQVTHRIDIRFPCLQLTVSRRLRSLARDNVSWDGLQLKRQGFCASSSPLALDPF